MALVGDSRLVGVGDTYNAATYLRGHVEKMLGGGKQVGVLNIAAFADRVQWYLSSNTNRSALLQYCSHILCNYGTNDIQAGGQSAATTHTRLQTLFSATSANITGKPIYQTTLEPQSTSTDSFVTEANQTTVSSNAARVTFNVTLRGGIANVMGNIDWAILFEESSAKTGVWRASDGDVLIPSGQALVADGVHLNPYGTLRVQALGQPISQLFTR